MQELLKPYKPVHPYRLPLMRSVDSRAGATTAVPAFCEKILQDIKKGLTSAQRYDILSEQSKSTYARVVELADSLDSGSSVHSGRAGSTPASRTRKNNLCLPDKGCVFSENRSLPGFVKYALLHSGIAAQ